MNSFALLFSFLFLFSSFGAAQNPAHFILGEKAFTNIDIYTLLYDDHSDLLYVGTNNGLYVYTQNRFIEIKGPEEQISNSFLQLQQGQDGSVFCCNLNGQIFKIAGTQMEVYYQLPLDEVKLGFYYFPVEDGNLLLLSQFNIRRINTKGESKILLNYKDENPFSITLGDFFQGGSKLLNGDVYIPIPSNKSSLLYRAGQFEEINSLPSKQDAILGGNYLSITDKVFAINNIGNLIPISTSFPTNFRKKVNEQLSNLNEEEIIGLDAQKGMRILSLQNDTLTETQSFFENTFLSTRCYNQNGTLFLGTFGEGIIVIPNKSIIQINYDHHFLSIATSPDNDVYLTTRNNELFQHKDQLSLVYKSKYPVGKIVYLPTEYSFSFMPVKDSIYRESRNHFSSIKDFHQLDEHTSLLIPLGEIILLRNKIDAQKDKLHYHRKSPNASLYYLLPSQRYTSATWSPSDSVFYFATNFGLYSRPWSSPDQDTLFWEGHSFYGNDLEYHKDQLICGTDKNGILFFKDKEMVAQLSQKNGLKGDKIKKILVQDELLYILSNAGIQIYDLEQKIFLGLGVTEGMVNNEVTDFVLSKDKLWLLEKHRYYSIDIAGPQKKHPMGQLYIDSILINRQIVDFTKQQQFNYLENEMNIFFDYRDIESKKETTIHYTLEGFYDDWKIITSTENNIAFQYLPPGHYTLKIKAHYRNQTSPPFVYAFEISPPFWQKWWFFITWTLAEIFIATVIAIAFLKNQRKKMAIRNELNTSKLTAIRSQMNPHFIFNSLNSIQHLVLKGDTDSSYSYISKFASLIRKTLDYSEREFITLEEEINLIEVYLTLEKLRFKDSFNFEIIRPQNLKVSIPPMLIQPFIENAILHGLLHKKGAKELKVVFQLDQKLSCTIEDNGIGREKAKAIKLRQKGTHKSFSLNAIKQRFEILSDYYDGDLGYEYQDFPPEENGEISTRVILKIPIRAVRKK